MSRAPCRVAPASSYQRHLQPLATSGVFSPRRHQCLAPFISGTTLGGLSGRRNLRNRHKPPRGGWNQQSLKHNGPLSVRKEARMAYGV